MAEEEKIYDIFDDNFTKMYGSHQIQLALENFQYIHNLVYPNNPIDHVNIICTFEREGTNLKEYLKESIISHLPAEGHKSIFAVNTQDHWTSLAIHNFPESIRVQYNDSANKEMPGVLQEVMDELGMSRNLKDYKSPMGGGESNCGRDMFFNLHQMVYQPNAESLDSPQIQNPEHHKMFRVFHVLFSSSLLRAVYNPEEAKILLNIFTTVHGARNLEEFEGNLKALYSYQMDQSNKDENDNQLLNACSEAMPQIKDHGGDSVADGICMSLIEQLKQASQPSTIPSTSIYPKDSGGGAEESKDSELKLVKDHHIEDLGVIAIYSNGSCHLWTKDNIKHEGSLENDEGMTTMHFPSVNVTACEIDGELTILGNDH